ncbi:MAG: pyridoxal phosphate-dependent aminotransferase [Andreesenia angusta]|nr:pyridoxal phosphate-dependent aminotransferase [Andreesenia angusta]
MKNNLSKKAEKIAPSLTLEISAMAAELKSKGINVIGFGVGEPDFETPKNIKDAAIEAINNGITRYTPTAGIVELREAICEKFEKDNELKYDLDNIVVSSGAKQSLSNAFMAILNPGDEVIIPNPYWVSYPEAIKLADGKPVLLETKEENGFKYSFEDLRDAINDKTKAIVLNSPSNPTGIIYDREDLEKIAELAVEKNIFIISDEIYEKLIYDGEHISIASINEDIKDLTITVNGVSKAYAMTGWRIGYTASNKKIAKLMSTIQGHTTSNANSIAQYASIEAIKGDQSEVDKMREEFKKRKDFMVNRINEIDNLSCLEPRGAFYIMLNISKLFGKKLFGVEINSSIDFTKVILEKGNVAVVPGIAFGNDNFVRLSYANSLENIAEGLNRIEKVLIEGR